MNHFTAGLVLVLITTLVLTAHIILLFKSHQHVLNGGAPSIPLTITWPILLIGATMVFMPAMDFFCGWFGFADIRYLWPIAWLGIVTGSGAVILYWRAHIDQLHLGRRNQLLDKGIYQYLRHPTHTALLLWAFTQLLLLQNWLGGLAAILTFAVVYLAEVPEREDHQLRQFGYLYLDYMDRTGGILPRLSGWARR